MQIETIVSGPIQTNTYCAYGAREGECFLVDPADAKKALGFMKERGLKPTHILLTHGHFDHILGVAQIKEETGAQVFISALDAAALYDDTENLSTLSRYPVNTCRADRELKDGDVFEAAGFTVRVISTPGHTLGGVCYLIESERVLFAGDTLFKLSVGRSDLPGGDPQALYHSIAYRLFTLPGDYAVYPGHAGATTLDTERAHNPYMKRYDPETW
ncbi:MAG: MBL fold metallo-hydrolase [Clostridiaceae bacterium]|nr:MBL fold metallo-hydrolase [Eubacteriales bacterium]